jgi:hypothetical protein
MRKRVLWIAGICAGIGLSCTLALGPASTPAEASPARAVTGSGSAAADTRTVPTVSPTPSPPREEFLCPGRPTAVVLLAEPALAGAVRADLDRFEADLCAGGYAAIERTLDFSAPPDVRAYLADLYARTDHSLEGAIFLGSVPLAYQSVQAESSSPDSNLPSEEVISFQYYSDLDGVFAASPGYSSPGRHPFSFDRHEGDTDWEIWTGVLPLYRGDSAQTAEALHRYFEKNHSYRSAPHSIPEGFLQISEHYSAKTAAEQAEFLEALRNGPYAWTPFSSAPGARLFFNGPTLSIRSGYDAISAGAADVTVTETHGNPTMSGMIDIAWVESRPVKTVLFWTDGCSVGNLEYPENFLTSVVYSPTSDVLVAKGSTNDSGGLGTNSEGFYGHNVAVRLAAGENLGRAILGHVNVPLIPPWSESREFHFSMLILIGDPTLRLR